MMANVADIYLIHGNIKYAFADLLWNSEHLCIWHTLETDMNDTI